MDISDDKYDQLITFIETGAEGNLPEEMVEYITLLELIRGLHMRFRSRKAIINLLQKKPYELSYYLASKRYTEAINFFYLDHEIKKDAWRNLYAEKLDRAADLVLSTATTSKDVDIYKNIIYAAMEARQLGKEDKEELPEEIFEKKIKIYTINPEELGRERPNRNLLASKIDNYNIPEKEKERLKSEAGITDIKIFPDESAE